MKQILTRYFVLAPAILLPQKLARAFQNAARKPLPKHLRFSHQWGTSYFQCLFIHQRATFLRLYADQVDLTVENPFGQCWASDSWTVNAADNEKINKIVRCFCSPAPPAYFALVRALELTPLSRHYEIFQIFTRLLKKGFYFVIRRSNNEDIEEWKILGKPEQLAAIEPGWEIVPIIEPFSSTVQIAHRLLDLATEASKRHQRIDQTTVDELVNLALERLYITLGTECRGRSAADAAFAFAMAGVTRHELYRILSLISYLEIDRMGPRPSLPSKNILQIVEKLAASGIRGPEVKPVYGLAAELLSLKRDRPDDSTIDALRNIQYGQQPFGMHSTRSLLWLWRFAARQSKVKAAKNTNDKKSFESSSASHHAPRWVEGHWVDDFDDPCKPLVVDVGCGMGVSLLGLAAYDHTDRPPRPFSIEYSQCNFIGGDINSLLVGYSSGIASRWELDGNTRFLNLAAEDLLDQIRNHYPGPIALVMIQFPTPFRLAVDAMEDGNSQLPADADSGFMVSPSLLRSVCSLLSASKRDNPSHKEPMLLLQSNCEDVAVAMRDLALEAGLLCVDASNPVEDLSSADYFDLPLRTQKWIKAGGERPAGREWSAEPLLPRYGQTETEVSCLFHGTPVHRCLLRVAIP